MYTDFIQIIYLSSAVCFILALKGLSSPETARNGNFIGMIGMGIAIAVSFFLPNFYHKLPIIITIVCGGLLGGYIASKIEMTAMPQLVAAFHSLVGLSSVLVAYSTLFAPEVFGIGIEGELKIGNLIEMALGAAIGAITFTGSIIAFGKLHGLILSKAIKFKNQQYYNIFILLLLCCLIGYFSKCQCYLLFNLIVIISFILGVLLILPIGGADMPVVVSMLNSYSGWAASGIGFSLGNSLMIITGAIVGASGAILSFIMCKAMNRSIFNVIFGAFYPAPQASSKDTVEDERAIRASSPEDASYILQNANSVIIVPGYGMAVAQAQYAIKELAYLLDKMNIDVRFAIHPVAGRMPGHMNVLLAEANIDYEKVLELEEINRDFETTDVVLVVGANDITNPAAKTDTTSPIYGMPILDVEKAKTIFFVKRGMAAGYAGVENDLFYRDNTFMLFGDAKKVIEGVVKHLES